jgi:SulP family sulfate permease
LQVLNDLKRFGGEVSGGAIGALVMIPIILSCGVVSYHSLGSDYVSAGIGAAFVSAMVAAIIAGLLGGPPLHVSSPKTSHAAILSGLIATVATHYSFSDYFPGAAAPGALMIICFITLFVAGLFQALLGAFRLGGLVKFVPYPVLAGVINGFALQIILGQMPNVLGVEGMPQVMAIVSGAAPVNWWPLGFTCLAGMLVMRSGRLSKNVPAALVALVVGTIAYATAGQYVGPDSLGPVIGLLPMGIPLDFHVDAMLGFVSSEAFQSHLFAIVATGITLALISSIQSLLSISSSDELFDTRHDSNKELLVQGGANMVSAVLGGAPSGGSPNITRTVHANGGRTRYANLTIALVLLGLSYGLSEAIARIPLSVMAGVVIVTTAATMDRWTHLLLRKVGTSSSAVKRFDALINLAVVLLVAGLVVAEGVLAALGVGIAIIFFVFLYRTNSTVIRRVLYADQVSSRTKRTMAAVQALLQHANQIAVLELNGPLFFGNTETVYQRIEAEMRGARWLIIGFKHCPVIDTSGAMLLKQLSAGLKKSGRRLLLSDLPAGGQRRDYLQNVGFDQLEKDGLVFEDMDLALAFAENELLGGLGLLDRCESEKSLSQFEMLAGMPSSEVAIIESMLQRHCFAPGDCIIREGAEDHSLYFLTSGKISVNTFAAGRRLRLASYSAGVDAMFGEMALLTKGTRSADVHADTAVTVLRLTLGAFERLCRDYPAVAVQLMQRMSQELSSRMTRMMHIVRELES